MADKRDYYESMGLSKTATDSEIKKAYRKLAKENHPDLNPGDAECEARFKEISEAYEVLSDSEKRQKYDQYGHAAFDPNSGYGGGFSGFEGFGDIFGDIFGGFGGFGGGGGSRSGPRRGENVRIGLDIEFEEAAFGVKKDISVSRVEHCPDCEGTGCAEGTTPEVCSDCRGTGTVRVSQRSPFGMIQTQAACSKCSGSGKIIHQACSKCKGKGNVRRTAKISVNIPAGIDNGQTVSMRGQGNAGRDGGPVGDLLITVSVRRSPHFKRDGNSVLSEATVSFTQAVLGAEITVKTLDGEAKFNVPEGTQPGTVLRMRGMGIPYLRGSGRGDQFVTVKVDVPQKLTNAQKDALREYSKAMGEDGASTGHTGFFGKKKK